MEACFCCGIDTPEESNTDYNGSVCCIDCYAAFIEDFIED